MMSTVISAFADEIADRLPDALTDRLAELIADEVANKCVMGTADEITNQTIYDIVSRMVEEIKEEMEIKTTDPIEGRMSHVSLPPHIWHAFNLDSLAEYPPRLLPGGAGTTYLLPGADAVLKPAQNPCETELMCNIWAQLQPDGNNGGFRISQPLRSVDGTFVYQGWSASKYIPDVRSLDKGKDEYTLDRIKRIIAASRALHAALRTVSLSATEIQYFYTRCSHVWARAHRAVWGTERDPQLLLAPFAPKASKDEAHPYVKLIQRLVMISDKLGTGPAENLKLYRECSQIIHGDLIGGDNVLFSTPLLDSAAIAATTNINDPAPRSLPPAVIDFSPAIAPESYAEGILLADALIWCRVGHEVLDLPGGDPTQARYDMLRRGLMFRCLSDIGLVESGNDAARPDLVMIERVVSQLEDWLAV